MGIRSFLDEETKNFFKNGKLPQKKGWASIHAIVQRKLDMLHYASDLKDLRNPPGNRLEKLVGNLQNCYSIRINEQWRIVFKWDNQPYNVQITDYH